MYAWLYLASVVLYTVKPIAANVSLQFEASGSCVKKLFSKSCWSLRLTSGPFLLCAETPGNVPQRDVRVKGERVFGQHEAKKGSKEELQTTFPCRTRFQHQPTPCAPLEVCEQLRYVILSSGKRPVSVRVVRG